MAKSKWQVGEKCKRCPGKLVIREGRPRNRKEKQWYYKFYLYCPKCKATYFHPDNRVFYHDLKKPETSRNRAFRKIVMDFYRPLTDNQKTEVERKFKSFMEMCA